MISFVLNGEPVSVDAPPDVPLLWILREECGAKSVKFGCGVALCGACTVHVDGQAVRACSWPLKDVQDKTVTTVEGLRGPDGGLHPVQQAWIKHNVPQCGYCQLGQIMSAVALLEAKPSPTDEDIDAVMSANLCRCGTYMRIRAAIHEAARAAKAPSQEPG